jgi:hypothetical protein
LGVHRRAHGAIDCCADSQVVLEPRATQVEEPEAQTDLLIDVRTVIKAERGLGGPEHLDGAVSELDLTGGQLVVDGALGAVPDGAGDLEHVLAAHIDRAVDHALEQARVVAQVDEGEVLAVLTTTADPATDPDGPADVAHAQGATQRIAQ